MSSRYTLLADGPAEVRRAVRESLRQGATAIKVMAGGGISSDYDPIDTVQYSVEELRAAVESAADWNTYVAVHAYTDESVNRSHWTPAFESHRARSSRPRRKTLAPHSLGRRFPFVPVFRIRAGILRRRRAADPNSKASQVMSGTDTLMNTAQKLGLPVAFGTDAFGSQRAYDAGVREFGYRLRWFDSLEILKQATSHNAKLLALTGPAQPVSGRPAGRHRGRRLRRPPDCGRRPALGRTRVLEDHANNVRLVMKNGTDLQEQPVDGNGPEGRTGTPAQAARAGSHRTSAPRARR